ncbi:MAG: YraN family protein [Pseudomonadota bacterium]
MTGASHLRRGRWAEEVTAKYLERQGLALLERNFRCRLGELDLVMAEGETLVFVEVRYRRGVAYGTALETIGARKQNKLLAAARVYLAARGRADARCRFDVVSVTKRNYQPSFHWLRDAFDQTR